MGARGVLCTIASICLLFSLIAAGIRSKKGREEASVMSLIKSLEKNEDMTQLLWVHCQQDLMHASGAEDLELNVQEEKSRYRNGIIWNRRWMDEIHRKKLFKVLNLKAKHSFMDCLKKKNIMSLTTVEERPYRRYLDFIYTRPDASTRRELVENFAGAPAPSPAFGSPSPSPAVGSPSLPPAPFSSSPAIPESQRHPGPPSPPFFPRDFNDSNLQPTSSEQTSSGSSSSSDAESNKKKTVLIAVLVTASATLIVSVLLFLCFRRTCGRGAMGRNDESPLLSLSMSDYSVASPQKSFGINTSINKERPFNHSMDAIPSHNKMTGDVYLDSHTLSSSKVNIPIGTVAGAGIMSAESSAPVTLGAAGLPPLKPPPGRTNSSIPTIGPGKGSPAPPPPPRPPAPPPPPLLKPSSVGPRPPVPGAPPPPPVPPPMKNGPRPPPPPSGGVPRPLPMGLKPPRPSLLGPNNPSTSTAAEGNDDNAPKTKLKPFFWDKVLANPDHSMVWHQIKSGSFQFNEEMIETLFGYAPPDKNVNNRKESSSQEASSQYIRIIDPKKSHNLAILLKALNVTTEEVRDALQEGNELPSEFIQTLLKMAPTTDEELKLRLFSGDLSCLGPAERFLKALVDIPFAFKRLECLLFMCTLQEESSMVKDSYATLEFACTDLRKSRLFLKLLEAVLKTGNRMNDGTFRGGAQAFKLDTLLKLSDVKGKDGKTTLLHFVVQEIIRSEGIRAARAAGASRSMSSIKTDDLLDDSSPDTEEHYRSIGLQKVSGLSNELENVKRAAVIDADSLTGTVAKLGHALVKARDFLNSEMKNVEEENGFRQTLRDFLQNAEIDVMWLLEEEKRIMVLVKSTGDYFHGNSAKDEGLRLFVTVRDFLIILDKVCKEVKITPRISNKTPRKEDETATPSAARQSPSPDPRQRLFPAIKDRRMDSSSSSDDDDDDR